MHDLTAINELLGAEAETVAVFDRIEREQPDFAATAFLFCRTALLKLRLYDRVLRYLQPEADLDRLIHLHDLQCELVRSGRCADDLLSYAEAMRQLSIQKRTTFIDLFDFSYLNVLSRQRGKPLIKPLITDDGIHLNALGAFACSLVAATSLGADPVGRGGFVSIKSGELVEARDSGRDARIAEEYGDLMFVMANLARHLAIDPETALRAANAKFIRRFEAIEAALAAEGRTPADSTLAEMDALWDAAKAREL